MRIQSGEIPDTEDVVPNAISTDTETTSCTVSFLDNAEGVEVDLPHSENTVALVDHTEDLSLGKFLSRPTLISSVTWSTSDLQGVLTNFKPWYEFLNSAAIKKKIDNYAFLRGNLKLKFIVNGTPFQYGALRACYSPLLGFVSDKIRTNPTSDYFLLVPYSQQPGIYIYPQTNAGGELTCRFFLHKNWLDITSASETQNMGTITYANFAPLQTALPTVPTSVTVKCYAWMTDVELMGSTSKLSLQSGEYGVGPVSRVASGVAAVASRLTNIPVFGPFARATEVGASAVSAIASIFGYTNVPVINDVCAYQPMNAPQLASAEIGTPVQKLALDPKQELCLDPSPHGIGNVDELSLSYLKGLESLYGTTTWDSAAAVGTRLWEVRVTPQLLQNASLVNGSAVTVGKRVYHTPLSYIGGMFKNWRGSIRLRFKVVCTKFHKGRLKISYDPRNDITATDPSENTVYTQILDIGEHDDVEFTIPYHQDLAWLRHDQTIQNNFGAGTSLAPRIGVDNGTLTIRVLNALVGPSTGIVPIMCYVRAGDDFEFANPTGHIGPDSGGTVPSFFAIQSGDITTSNTQRVSIGVPSQPLPQRYALNFGECVGSLRSVLHRYMVCDTVPLPSVTSGLLNILRKQYKRMPYTPGFDPVWTSTSANKVIAASGNAGYAFNTMSHLAYVAGMFLGYRGGVNYIVTPSCDQYGFLDDLRVVRSTDATSVSQRFIATVANSGYTPTTSNKAYILGMGYYVRDGLAGMAITTTRTNGSIQFNFPDYNNFNFSLVDPTTYVVGSATDGTNVQVAHLQINLKRVDAADPDTALSCSIQTEVAAGPDFNCLHFLCCPTLDYLVADPTPI